MSKFSAYLTMMFSEVAFLNRFEKAARNGFTAVEYAFPYDWPPQQLQELLQKHNVQQLLFNLPIDERASGVRGIACIPRRSLEFQDLLHRI